MIQERYCSLEVSKLLKEKGFDEACLSYFWTEENGADIDYSNIPFTNKQLYSGQTLRPTHQMAMDWLRKKHGILISIIPQEVAVGVTALCYGIYRIIDNSYHPIHNGQASTSNDYKDVVEAALEFCLTELIK